LNKKENPKDFNLLHFAQKVKLRDNITLKMRRTLARFDKDKAEILEMLN